MLENKIPPNSSNVVQLPGTDTRERLLVLSVELARRTLEAGSLDELYYIMTNDVRVLIDFDRSFLITHFDGKSLFTAAGNQPIIEKKSKFNDELNKLAPSICKLDKPLLLTGKNAVEGIADEAISVDMKEALAAYLEFADCRILFCIPLVYNKETLGHLIFEFMSDKSPDQAKILTILNLAPFLGTSLALQWAKHRFSGIDKLTEATTWRDKPVIRHIVPNIKALLVLAMLVVIFFFVLPFPYTVGGEAEILPKDRHMAFCKMDGIVDKVKTLEGAAVNEGDVLAVLDPTEIDHKIRTAKRQIELLSLEAQVLKNSADQDMGKLAESRLVELKRKSVVEELQYLEWQRQFTDIKAPASGIVVTKHIETLTGKKFKAGEPFAEVAVPKDLLAEIHVPEDRVAFVKVGQNADLYLNSDPFKNHPLKVQEIAPKAETEQRAGNIYRVKAVFTDQIPDLKVGMKAVGKINTGPTSLWSMVTQRIRSKWNHLLLYFW